MKTVNGMISVTEHLFDKDALCLEKQGVHAVGLCDAAGKEYVRLEADCPVWGICDSKGYGGTLQNLPYTNAVEAGKVWKQEFRIVIL